MAGKTYETPEHIPYFALKDGQTEEIAILTVQGEHAEFTCGKDPAPVLLIEDANGKNALWSITSTKLREVLGQIAKDLGQQTPYPIGVTLEVTPIGRGKDRRYRIAVPELPA